MCLGLVDGRDVAEAHVKAMTCPEAKNQRYLIASENQYSIVHVRDLVEKNFPNLGIPTPSKRPNPRTCKTTDTSKVVKLIGHDLIAPETSVVDMVNSFIKLGLVK